MKNVNSTYIFESPYLVARKVIKLTLAILFLGLGTISHVSIAKLNTQSLELIESPHFDIFRIAEVANLPTSRKIYVSHIDADFDSAWLKEFRSKTTKTYRNRVLRDYSRTLEDQIKQKLIKSGWSVFDEPEEGILVLKTKLTDLYIFGPQVITREHVLVTQIGQSSVTFSLEGTDRHTIFEGEDKGIAGGIQNHFIETNEAINFSRFNRLMTLWATNIVYYADTIIDG
ncbi:hypothetical protein L0668_10900 [Paraglaciecola aquimarina]|uniref:DUF3313 domain-containing protein n=1 Tax=Paraglaciecola algarum TaxID=3050085 RepID=A0ABS9D8C0_9ALTE|nr:hypothetical protein [Paraglaciecola sp. G1-23]MCF2948615.1 hypothetical protein [Paraglaciecola sp. G1-23]